MNLHSILKLGNPKLYEKSTEVFPEEMPDLKQEIDRLNNLIVEFKSTYGVGRGIAAPQIGLQKRIICLNIDNRRYTLINPVLSKLSPEMMEIWDDCMCFPNFLVKVKRHQKCTVTFRDELWQEHSWSLEGDLSELIQHEYDHLDGILATQRAIDDKSFKLKS